MSDQKKERRPLKDHPTHGGADQALPEADPSRIDHPLMRLLRGHLKCGTHRRIEAGLIEEIFRDVLAYIGEDRLEPDVPELSRPTEPDGPDTKIEMFTSTGPRRVDTSPSSVETPGPVGDTPVVDPSDVELPPSDDASSGSDPAS